jgi:hypothetical protein
MPTCHPRPQSGVQIGPKGIVNDETAFHAGCRRPPGSAVGVSLQTGKGNPLHLEDLGMIVMTTEKLVCGKGAACEQTCPVMSMGRICPTVEEFMEELAGMCSEVQPAA